MYVFERAVEGAPTFRERTQYPFEAMEIGDSLFLQEFRKAESARISAIQFVKRRGLDWKFSMQKTREGWRIFRIK